MLLKKWLFQRDEFEKEKPLQPVKEARIRLAWDPMSVSTAATPPPPHLQQQQQRLSLSQLPLLFPPRFAVVVVVVVVFVLPAEYNVEPLRQGYTNNDARTHRRTQRKGTTEKRKAVEEAAAGRPPRCSPRDAERRQTAFNVSPPLTLENLL